MNDKPLHLHFGPGNLGHGLIADLHDPDRVDLMVVHRRSNSAIARHLASTQTMNVRVGQSEPRAVPLFAYVVADSDTGRDQVVSEIRQRSTVIVTTSVGQGQPDVIAFLSGLPADLWRDRSATVIPCENRPDPGWAAFAAISHARVLDNLVVDRICTQPDPEVPIVVAEPYAEFVVESNGDEPTAELIGATVVPDVTIHRRRKLYLVNGLQLAIALLALEESPERPDGSVRINDYLRTERGAIALQVLAREYLLAFNRPFAGELDVDETWPYLEIAMERIEASDDRATRVIMGGSGSLEFWMSGALTKFDTRLTTPLGEYVQASGAAARETFMWRAWENLKVLFDQFE